MAWGTEVPRVTLGLTPFVVLEAEVVAGIALSYKETVSKR